MDACQLAVVFIVCCTAAFGLEGGRPQCRWGEMDPKQLVLILLYVSAIPRPSDDLALDAVPCRKHITKSLVLDVFSNHLNPNPKSKVEICAGEGALTKALQSCGMKTKAFDVAGLHQSNPN